MLLRFAIENHLSIKDRQELSMVSAPALKDRTEHLIPCPASPSGYVVPVAIIYGANASGKSNIVSSVRYFLDSLENSHAELTPKQGIWRRPFLLDSESVNRDTLVEIDFVLNNVRHNYGFECNSESYISEWLGAYPKGRLRKLFERHNQEFRFGDHLKGQNSYASMLASEDRLFMWAAAQLSHRDITKLYGSFLKIKILRNLYIGKKNISNVIGGEVHPDKLLKILDKLIGGVETIGYSFEDESEFVNWAKSNLDSDHLEYSQDNEAVMSLIRRDAIEGKSALYLVHRTISDSLLPFDLDWESAGTRRLIVLLHHAFIAIEQGSPLIIDEMDASLHTQACEAIIALFSSPETNPKGAQLIATTHDTNLLRSPMLRRDQIWFTEKDDGGATHLYPLSDFKVRKEDNLEKGYLQGRFGAIPFAGSAYELFGKGDHAA